MRRIVLKPGREGPVRAGHPWIFSGAIAHGLEDVEPGEPVRVCAASGAFVAVGYAHPRTSIAVRVLSLLDEPIDAALVRRRLDEAVALRRAVLPPDLRAYRVLNGEGDRLPGVVVDRYGEFLVCQLLTAGAARLAPALVDGLAACPPASRRRPSSRSPRATAASSSTSPTGRRRASSSTSGRAARACARSRRAAACSTRSPTAALLPSPRGAAGRRQSYRSTPPVRRSRSPRPPGRRTAFPPRGRASSSPTSSSSCASSGSVTTSSCSTPRPSCAAGGISP